MNSYDSRFGGMRRLFGVEGQERLRRAHVGVVGIGGVGSWAVEALARAGVGRITLVDLDDVCISNVNRQLHALTGAFGQPKVDVMAERVRRINPDVEVRPVGAFFTASTAAEILGPGFDYVFDAIDDVAKKVLLIVECRDRGIPVVTSGGAAGRRDPGRVRVDDLAFASHDRLLQAVRRTLRKSRGFPAGDEPFDVGSVFSTEPPVYPQPDGSVCAEPGPGADLRLDCNSGFGTAAFVTGTFGLVAAGHIVERLAQDPQPVPAGRRRLGASPTRAKTC